MLISSHENRLRTCDGTPLQIRPAGRSVPDADQKARLSEIERRYQGKIAEREIFLKNSLKRRLADQNAEEIEKIKKQLASERARLEEDREDEKERVRKGSLPGRRPAGLFRFRGSLDHPIPGLGHLRKNARSAALRCSA